MLCLPELAGIWAGTAPTGRPQAAGRVGEAPTGDCMCLSLAPACSTRARCLVLRHLKLCMYWSMHMHTCTGGVVGFTQGGNCVGHLRALPSPACGSNFVQIMMHLSCVCLPSPAAALRPLVPCCRPQISPNVQRRNSGNTRQHETSGTPCMFRRIHWPGSMRV